MINLYAVGNTDYTTNGDATLTPISATIKKVINGMWQLTMELPYDEDGKYTYLDHGAMLKVVDPSVSEVSNTQLWRVYDYKRNIRSITVIAFPRAMESTFDAPITQLILSSDVTGASAASSLSAVSEKYSVTSNIERTGRSEWSNTNLNRAICGTDSNAFVNVWGGEVVYDNLTIKILDGIGSSENMIDVMYGKNINEISYEVDDSGLTTRIYPLSTDGIRYWDATEEVEYIDSPLIEDYPIVHSNFMETPYQLVIDDDSDISRTAVKTRDIKSRIQAKASQLSHSIWNTAVANGWKIDYLSSIYADIIANIQTMVTTNIAHADFVKAVNSAVKDGMIWMKDEEDPEWVWEQVGTDAWKYGSSESGRYARNEWQYIDKKWRWFGDDYLWQQPRDDDTTWTWYESKTTHKLWYGTQDKYYLSGQYIYYTDPDTGEFTKYWLDGDGWYDASKKDTSDYEWHQDPETANAWFFGTVDGDGYRDKYISGQWVFIEGTLYWFDDNGYYYGEKKEQPQYEWNQSGEAWWFGNAENKMYDAEWLASQWCKIDRQWYKFDADGYTEDIYTQALTMFHNGMSELTTLVQTCRSECYALLYDLMEEWSEEQFANGVDVPTVTINVDMVDLSKTTDYADYQNLETIHLGDTVRCVDYVHHIATIERVVELTYDLLRGYNTSVTIGVANSTVGSMLSGSTGGGTASNNAINVDFIEQSLALKQPTLEAGKNITLTDNLDGTQTIASDKLIRAGENVSVQHNSDGSDTISASGGALTWWHENQSNLYSDNVWEGDTWHAMQKYYFDYKVGWWNRIYSDRYREKSYAVPAIIGYACIGATGNSYGMPIIISDKPEGVMVSGYGGDNQPPSGSFTYKGKTWYMGATGGYFAQSGNPTPDEPPAYGVFYGFTPTDSQYRDSYPDYETAGKALIDYAELSFERTTYHGFSRGGNLAFFAGGDDSTGTNANIKIYSNGDYEGLDKVEDITDGEGNSILVNKVADISHKQNTLVEGDNITLTPQQDGTVEISATTDELAELTDVDIDSETLVNGQNLKYNSETQKWVNGYPFLTMINGVLTIVYDDDVPEPEGKFIVYDDYIASDKYDSSYPSYYQNIMPIISTEEKNKALYKLVMDNVFNYTLSTLPNYVISSGNQLTDDCTITVTVFDDGVVPFYSGVGLAFSASEAGHFVKAYNFSITNGDTITLTATGTTTELVKFDSDYSGYEFRGKAVTDIISGGQASRVCASNVPFYAWDTVNYSWNSGNTGWWNSVWYLWHKLNGLTNYENTYHDINYLLED